MKHPLTLDAVARNPENFTTPISLATSQTLLLRPLLPSDVEKLARFLADLSPQSRRLSTFSGYDQTAAQELCDAIARYDKLRLALVEISLSEQPIVGLLEFSFDLTSGDISRYANYGFPLNPGTACRFGPTLADGWQNRGVGSLLLPAVWAIARRFERNRVILWGGVLADNAGAIRFYEKNGFRHVGRFVNGDGQLCCDMIVTLDGL
ncbi:MAG: GNAT family N-acetyltransferase [Chloroflexi bacterium]|nr:GNAT family N-acetyltransferase [Chloroflexota bacterium]